MTQRLYTMQPMNSGRDFKGREMDVASPVMAAGQTLGNQGGDVVVQAFTQNQREEVRDLGDAAAAVKPPGTHESTLVRVAKPFVKVARARAVDGEGERWDEDDVSPTLNTFDNGDARAVTLVAQETAHSLLAKPNSSHAADMDTYVVAATLNSGGNDGGFRTEPGEHLVTMGALREHVRPGSNTDYSILEAGESMVADEAWWAEYLPEGLDSHRYRCCGNGVISNVAEWIGARLYAELSTSST